MPVFDWRELQELRDENDELSKEILELTRKISALEMKLFKAYGRESQNYLAERLELSSIQRSKLGLLFSIETARLAGVPENEIIHDHDELDQYFSTRES